MSYTGRFRAYNNQNDWFNDGFLISQNWRKTGVDSESLSQTEQKEGNQNLGKNITFTLFIRKCMAKRSKVSERDKLPYQNFSEQVKWIRWGATETLYSTKRIQFEMPHWK